MSRAFDVAISSIATAVPRYRYDQNEALERSRSMMPQFSNMGSVFHHTGVGHRYSCVPTDWYLAPPGWRESNEVYLENAIELLSETASTALASAGLAPQDVDAVVSVSSTGLAIPSLEARLANRMHFSPHTERLPIFGLGCAGGTSGLARATRMAQSIEGGAVLLLVVELAGINVHVNLDSAALFVSTALFGDGAAAVILRNTLGNPDLPGYRRNRVVATGEYQWRDTEDIMGWKVEDDGLDVILSSALPKFTERNLRPVAESFLQRHGYSLGDLEGFVFHPGGRKILEAIAKALDIADDRLRHSWDILHDFGNMSAPTVLFILQRTIQSGSRGLHLMASFGPGFTVTFALLDL